MAPEYQTIKRSRAAPPSRLGPAAGVATRVRREHFGECTRTLHQGISQGWVDVYPNDLHGQSLTLPAGEQSRWYCLEATADPRDHLEETDNATAVGLVVTADRVALRPSMDCA